jgi:hypothetical protein
LVSGNVVCNDCSTKRMVRASADGATAPERICDKCVEALAARQAEVTAKRTAEMLDAIKPYLFPYHLLQVG